MVNIAEPSVKGSKASFAAFAIWGILLIAALLRVFQLGTEGI